MGKNKRQANPDLPQTPVKDSGRTTHYQLRQRLHDTKSPAKPNLKPVQQKFLPLTSVPQLSELPSNTSLLCGGVEIAHHSSDRMYPVLQAAIKLLDVRRALVEDSYRPADMRDPSEVIDDVHLARDNYPSLKVQDSHRRPEDNPDILKVDAVGWNMGHTVYVNRDLIQAAADVYNDPAVDDLKKLAHVLGLCITIEYEIAHWKFHALEGRTERVPDKKIPIANTDHDMCGWHPDTRPYRGLVFAPHLTMTRKEEVAKVRVASRAGADSLLDWESLKAGNVFYDNDGVPVDYAFFDSSGEWKKALDVEGLFFMYFAGSSLLGEADIPMHVLDLHRNVYKRWLSSGQCSDKLWAAIMSFYDKYPQFCAILQLLFKGPSIDRDNPNRTASVWLAGVLKPSFQPSFASIILAVTRLNCSFARELPDLKLKVTQRQLDITAPEVIIVTEDNHTIPADAETTFAIIDRSTREGLDTPATSDGPTTSEFIFPDIDGFRYHAVLTPSADSVTIMYTVTNNNKEAECFEPLTTTAGHHAFRVQLGNLGVLSTDPRQARQNEPPGRVACGIFRYHDPENVLSPGESRSMKLEVIGNGASQYKPLPKNEEYTVFFFYHFQQLYQITFRT